MINILIVHYNTPDMTEALCESINKHVKECTIYVFDNSDKEPFRNSIPNVKVIDNTRGQIIDFDKWLRKFQLKPKTRNKWASARHCKSVDICFDLIPEGFILMDSDILITRDVSELWDERVAYVGEKVTRTYRKMYEIARLEPYLCYINVPMCKRNGIRYFNWHYMWALTEKTPNRYYDTGAYFLYACERRKLSSVDVNINAYMVHYGSASWNDKGSQKDFLEANKPLCEVEREKTRIYICTHLDFVRRVWGDEYRVLDMREIPDDYCHKGLRGSFYSELVAMKYVMEHTLLPKYIGFCHYRRYFGFLSDVPDMDEVFAEYDCVATEPTHVAPSVYEQYWRCHNHEDLDIACDIVKDKYPEIYKTLRKMLVGEEMYACNMFIMRRQHFVELMHFVFGVLDEFVKIVGTDIDARIVDNRDAYIKRGLTAKYQYRIGGYLAERLTSAFIMHKFKNVKRYPLSVLDKRLWQL